MPKVSVIIPCYNAEKYLEQCISSVRNQTLQDIEIICVDDGSTDGTRRMLKEYEAADPRIKVFFQQNKFAGIARNTGMEAATGEYFAFLDSDDYYMPDGLEKAYQIAVENDLDMLKLSSYLLDDCTGEITTNAHYSHERFTQKNGIVQFSDAPKNMLNCADVAWNGLYSRKFIMDSGIRFNGFRCVNDRSFYISCMLTAKRIMVADEYLTYYRRNIAGSLVSIRYKHFDCQINSYNLIREIVAKADCSAANKKMILQFELNQIFIWYDKFLDSGVNVFQVESIIRDFVANYDAADVGEDFVGKFQRKHHFARFKKSLEIRWQTEPLAAAPNVTVAMPCHNGVKYLSECVESILLQTMRDFELICIDDGSEDATVEMLQCFAEKDSRIRIICQPQSGAGAARNNAISHAEGKYIVFVDCDDKIREEYLQDLVKAAEANRADVVIAPQISWNGSGEGSVMYNWIAAKRMPQNRPFNYKDAPDYIMNFTDGGPGGKLFRSAFVREHGLEFLTIRRSEDFYFVYSAIVVAESVFYLNKPGYYYRKNNATSLENTKDQTPRLFWDATMMLKENLERLGVLEEIRRSYQNSLVNRFCFNMKAVKSFEGFSSVFYLFKKICSTELELDQHEKKYFFETTAYDYLMPMMDFETPEDFLYGQYKRQMTEIADLRRKISNTKGAGDLEKSASYRIGRIITFIPRKMRGFAGCIQDHGLKYTLRYALKKLIGR